MKYNIYLKINPYMKYLRKFEEYDLGHRFSEEELTPLELNEPTGDEDENIYSDDDIHSDDDSDDEENCVSCGDDESNKDEDESTRTWGDENITSSIMVEKIVSFKQFEAKKNTKGKTPKTEKEKELAGKYPPKDKITKGDFIAAAIENKKGKKEEDKKGEDKKEEEKGGKGLTAAQKKLPEGLRKAIEAKNKKK
jgi:hypothetical protein